MAGETGAAVGYLWIGQEGSESDAVAWWIRHSVIDAGHRAGALGAGS